jgi:hypothetical protein
MKLLHTAAIAIPIQRSGRHPAIRPQPNGFSDLCQKRRHRTLHFLMSGINAPDDIWPILCQVFRHSAATSIEYAVIVPKTGRTSFSRQNLLVDEVF